MGRVYHCPAADGGEDGELGEGGKRFVEWEGAGLAIDGDGELRAEAAVLDDALVEAGTAHVEGTEDGVERVAVNFEARGAGTEGAKERGDDGGGHLLREHHPHRMQRPCVRVKDEPNVFQCNHAQ